MVSLDKEKILAEVKKIKEGKEDRSKLKELIGGEEMCIRDRFGIT